MKNVFLIGNGFDLHHFLPTKYFDFMSVAEYLINHTLTEPVNVGTVFSSCTNNKNIQKCYSAHKEAFDSTTIPIKTVSEISSLLSENIWFNYFSKTQNIDDGWIDFEKEISMVLATLDENIPSNNIIIHIPKDNPLSEFVFSNFNFFIELNTANKINQGDKYKILDTYLIESPHNSRIFISNKKKIFSDLYNELLNFNKALGLYLDCFIEKTFDLLKKDNTTKAQKISLVNLSDYAISFNYTSTLEKFYFNKFARHIHGTVEKNNIVLGINPNELDNIGTNSTNLIKFKKYYQREAYGTILEYINWYKEIISVKMPYRVITIGHSLDVTDKDVISDIFLNAEEIYISYYDDECKENYFNNIIKIFGNEGYNRFIKDKILEFIPLSEIENLEKKIKPPQIAWEQSGDFKKMTII